MLEVVVGVIYQSAVHYIGYTVCNRCFESHFDVKFIILLNPDISMIEVRTDILESFNLTHRELRAMFYEDVMEQAFEVGRQADVVEAPAKKESVMEKLAQAAEKTAPASPSPKRKEPER